MFCSNNYNSIANAEMMIILVKVTIIDRLHENLTKKVNVYCFVEHVSHIRTAPHCNFIIPTRASNGCDKISACANENAQIEMAILKCLCGHPLRLSLMEG